MKEKTSPSPPPYGGEEGERGWYVWFDVVCFSFFFFFNPGSKPSLHGY